MGASRRAALVVTAALLVAGTLIASGCARNSAQTQVVTEAAQAEEATGTITPLERGEVRREVLAVAEPGIAAFIAGDSAAISRLYAAEFAEPLLERMEENAEAGKVRVRVHEDVQMDVVSMSDDGKQAIIEYNFTDKSYFESESGERLSEPATKETVFQLTMDESEEGWQITRIIGADDLLQ